MRFASGAATGETAASTTEVVAVLKGFRAVPLSAEAQARRAGQFTRFIALVPVEYGRGVRDGKITNDIEVQEAVSFRDAAQAAYDDLYVTLAAINAPAADAIGAGLASVEQQMRTVAAPADLEATVNDIARRFAALSPPEWQTIGGGSDLDVINAILDQIPVAVREGRYELAESARIEAYAVHDSGTEQRLLGYAPDLNARIELLFWGGTAERPGLATLLAARAPLPQISTALAQVRAELKEAEKLLSTKSAPEAVVGNAAVIVFREGLEAVLILASLLASLRTAETIKFRRPIIAGSVLALTATAATWWAANLLLMSLIRFGERLEAIVSLVAIGVLLVILNWFFHKVYWTGWIAGFHQRKGRIIAGGLALSQVISLMVLGFSSIYREGFETVLFLQSLVLDAGLGTVLQGVAIGMAGVSVIGVITFALQVRLPYKKMLIVTGVMIGAVLLVMVGNTVHVLQVVGWLPITPISGLFFPHWMGQWFGLYATWQGIGFQIAAVVYVFGSYYWAESVNTPRRRRVQENAA
jgi:high-affinity iron transporter